ncbi:hypothetical protein [Microtetraspora niveoalba]|uniref:hypothetical protein n=1 Tax=Microtetraspora niveoalba TaxID=46175 RepID=UPI00082DF8CB|nr:hypothetical protein [Microtetraspora niveoalba]
MTAIWVQSDLLPDGTYVVAIHYDDDQSRVLNHEAALRYAAAVHAAATRAEHDAAVVAQLVKIGLPKAIVAQALHDLRNDRPPHTATITAPLQLEPCVSAHRGVGYLEVYVAGRLVGQWDPDDARDHAANVLAVLAAVDLDAAYRRYLIGTVGLDRARAEAAVGGLAAHLNGETRRT